MSDQAIGKRGRYELMPDGTYRDPAKPDSWRLSVEMIQLLADAGWSAPHEMPPAIEKERAACAKIARDEAEHLRAVASQLPSSFAAVNIERAKTAERIARAIQRGDK